MFLLNTNVWLERLLDREHSEEVGNFLGATPSDQLWITDLAFHSLAVVMTRLGRGEALLGFVRDAFTDGAVNLVHLQPEDTQGVLSAMKQYSLGFDDAYQYAAAEKNGLALVSFDSDFDRTPVGRKTPAGVMPE